MKKLLPIILILFAVPCFGEWGNFTGAELVHRCQNAYSFSIDKAKIKANIFDQGVCLGHLHGIKLMLNRTDITYPKNFSRPCIPEEISQIQLVESVLNLADSEPHLLEDNATKLVITAWSKAFPCK